MTFDPDSIFPPSASSRRISVVAQALTEKYQKLSLIRRDLDREHRAIRDAAANLERKIREVDSEIDELREALRAYDLVGPQEPFVVDPEEARWRREQRRFSLAQGKAPAVEFFPESRQQKQFVIDQVRMILETFGNMHVRDIHAMLRTEDREVPSLQRLSQILSESEMFEADRSKGWSLKEERPGLGQPGLSVSTTTPSGDGS